MAMNELISSKLVWFLKRFEYSECGEDELGDFLLYVQESHANPLRRWETDNTASHKPMSRRSVRTYYSYLTIIFNWMVARRVLELSPMRTISPPEYQKDQLQSFFPDQIEALLHAAARSRQPMRNVAMLLLMLDTGLRTCEVCDIKLGDVDFEDSLPPIRVVGKGRKKREVHLGKTATNALCNYVEHTERDWIRDAHELLFLGERGDGLACSGIKDVYNILGRKAGLKCRCHSHKMQRTVVQKLSIMAPRQKYKFLSVAQPQAQGPSTSAWSNSIWLGASWKAGRRAGLQNFECGETADIRTSWLQHSFLVRTSSRGEFAIFCAQTLFVS